MQYFITLLNAPWLGTTLAIVSILAAVYFYVKSIRSTSMGYQTSEFTLIGSATSLFPKQVQILFNNSSVPRLTSTTFVFWNSGTELIRGSQIVSSDTLRIEVSEGIILQGSVLKRTREANKFSIDASESMASVMFDFLDPEDGATVEILHTAPRNSTSVKGILMGLPKGVSYYGKLRTTTPSKRFPFSIMDSKIGFIFMFVFGLVLMIFGINFDYLIKTEADVDFQKSIKVLSAIVSGTGVLYMIFPILLVWQSRRRFPSTLDILPGLARQSKDLSSVEFDKTATPQQ